MRGKMRLDFFCGLDPMQARRDGLKKQSIILNS